MRDSRAHKVDQLERKLKFLLGSQKEWVPIYSNWLADNDIAAERDGYPTQQAYDDHNINLFVRRQRDAKAPGKPTPDTDNCKFTTHEA